MEATCECGDTFEKNSNSHKYCKSCAKDRGRVRSYRWRVDNGKIKNPKKEGFGNKK